MNCQRRSYQDRDSVGTAIGSQCTKQIDLLPQTVVVQRLARFQPNRIDDFLSDIVLRIVYILVNFLFLQLIGMQ